MKEELVKIKIKDDSQSDVGENPKEGDKSESHEKTDIPLEKMTKAQLVDKIKQVQESADENYDLYIRSQAEMDNMKKRFQKDKQDLIKFSNESLVKQLLPVMDNLENAISHSQDEGPLDALNVGVELTLKGLKDTLEKAGMKEVKAMGEPFDPNCHEAISEQEDDSVEPKTVIQELQKGYFLNQRLIRPAMVIVSKNAA
ncbi:MAG: nucleotide exchange factor GrpE [Deltaproteobacteria bacterium]|nr:nucleotide exchange factor GrpE [Deltaproteobacteria bacterium]MBW2118512.1 nucleotide exchange factor GrpE [Deltaproteobacteria bacterium]MBW2343904.1 nucleotide exchange factor GrpE [Deltaproteobacteria bacterium]